MRDSATGPGPAGTLVASGRGDFGRPLAEGDSGRPLVEGLRSTFGCRDLATSGCGHLVASGCGDLVGVWLWCADRLGLGCSGRFCLW